MRKKITSLLSLMLMVLCSLPAFAQAVSEESTTSDFDASKKYAIQTHGQDGSTHWMFDAGTNISADDNMDQTTPDTKYLWTITADGDKWQVRNVGTGNYLSIDGTGNGGSTSTKADATSVTIEASNENVAFKNDNGQYVDMSYSGMSPCTWNGGVNGSRVMTIYEVSVELTEEEIAMAHLVAVFDKYANYVEGLGSEFVPLDFGTEIGQYSVDLAIYEKFCQDMNLAFEVVMGSQTMTAEQMEALGAAIEEAYKAIMQSLVPLTIADGNYRIVSAMYWTKTTRTDTGEVDENDQPIYDEVVTHPTKAMYATLEDQLARWADIDSTDCRYLWKLTNDAASGNIQVMNIATDGIINTCTQSAQAKLTTDSETKMYFEFKRRTEEGKIVVAFRPSASGAYGFLHAGGHGGGAGNNGSIVGWEAGADATQWILEPVDDETVATLIDEYAPFKNHALLVERFEELKAKADSLITIARDETHTELITKASQLSCPFGQNDLYPGQADGGNIGTLVDGNPSTFYHTAWGGGNLEPGSHWLFATFDEPVGGENLMVTITRRSGASNDHVSKMDVYVAEDIEANAEDFTLAAQLEFPYGGAGETVSSALFNVEGEHSVYKFVVTETAPTSNNRGYFHMAEFGMASISINETSQLVGMGEIGANLIAALEEANEVDVDDLEMEQYEALKSAYEAALAIFVDPTPLRNAIKANKNAADVIVEGENPGFWSEGSDGSAFAAVLEEAMAYDKAGIYTKAQSEEFIARIEAGVEDIFASANPMEPGKWYSIRFASEEMYDTYEWQKSNAVNEVLGDLYDSYLSAAVIEGEGEDQQLVQVAEMEDVVENTPLRFISEDILESMDACAFRLVAQGDTAYVLQHRSGLYVTKDRYNGAIALGLTPALFDAKACGLGKMLIHARGLNGAELGGAANPVVYLHAQNAGHSLVTWHSAEVGSNSALLVEPIDEGDLYDTDVAESIVRKVMPNSMRIWTSAAEISVSEGAIYEFEGSYTAEDGIHFAFTEIEKAPAGQPVLYVNGDLDSFDQEVEAEDFADEYITASSENFAIEAGEKNGMVGTFSYKWVDPGTVVVGGGKIAQWGNVLVAAEGEDNTDCTRDISAGTGYILANCKAIQAGEYDLELVVTDEDAVDGIKSLESLLNNSEVVFNLAGQRVVKAQKGIFIIGGKKVMK